MAQTKKNILDFILMIVTKQRPTDESRFSENLIYYLIDQVRAELIIKQYAITGIIDPTWLSLPMKLTMHRTSFSDDSTVICGCDVSKTQIPQTISLISQDGNLDLGVYRITSLCGKTQYFYRRMFQWGYTPKENTMSLFKYYDRYGTFLYVNNPQVDELLLVPILLNPEDGVIINSDPVLSGSLVNGTVYIVKYGTIIYNNVPYESNAIFTANATTTFTGNGKVYLDSQVQAFNETDPYPASGEMIRQIQFEILTKEFKIEAGEIPDVRNDSVDDANKIAAV